MAGRPSNAEKSESLYLKSIFQEIDKKLNVLEAIGQKPLSQQREEELGKIWLTVGKLMIMLHDIEEKLGVYED